MLLNLYLKFMLFDFYFSKKESKIIKSSSEHLTDQQKALLIEGEDSNSKFESDSVTMVQVHRSEQKTQSSKILESKSIITVKDGQIIDETSSKIISKSPENKPSELQIDENSTMEDPNCDWKSIENYEIVQEGAAQHVFITEEHDPRESNKNLKSVPEEELLEKCEEKIVGADEMSETKTKQNISDFKDKVSKKSNDNSGDIKQNTLKNSSQKNSGMYQAFMMEVDRLKSEESVKDSSDLGMISHKKSIITIFGHKHKIKNFIKEFDIFHEKFLKDFEFWFIFGIK